LDLPVVDINDFFNKETDVAGYTEECRKLSECLHLYGAAIVRDPRFPQEENTVFLDQVEEYFELSDGRRGK
jgi:hypothetical protein